MDKYVGAILLTKDKQIILQHRDDNPNIRWPNTWSVFGGGVEGEETTDEALARELYEELELDLGKHRFEFYKMFEQRVAKTPEVSGDIDCSVFVVYDVDPEQLVVREGQGHVLFHQIDEDVWQKASPTMKEIVESYIQDQS